MKSDPRETQASAVEGETEAGDAGSVLRTLVWVVIFIAGLALLSRFVRPPRHALDGKAAPDFSLAVLDTTSKPTAFPDPKAESKRLTLGELRGRPVLLDFWATWCGPCQAQSPILDGLQKRLAERGLTVVGVATNDVPAAANRWARSHGLTYTIVSDEDGAVSRKYGVANLPTLVLVAKDGTIKAVRVGLTDAGELERLVLKEL